MERVVLFIGSYLLVLLLYQLFIVNPMKRYKNSKDRNKKEKKDPVEIRYLINRYKLDIDKVDYNQLLQIVALTSSLDITLIVTIISIIENYFLALLLGVVLIVIIFLISYHFIAKFYKKRGMIRDV